MLDEFTDITAQEDEYEFSFWLFCAEILLQLVSRVDCWRAADFLEPVFENAVIYLQVDRLNAFQGVK